MSGLIYKHGHYRMDERYSYDTGYVAMTPGDALTLETTTPTGKVKAAIVGGPIIGVAQNALPNDPKNTGTYNLPNTVPHVLVPDDDTVFSIEATVTPVASKQGSYANLIVSGGTGTHKLDSSTIAAARTSANTSTGVISSLQLFIVGVDPTNSKNYLVTISNLMIR